MKFKKANDGEFYMSLKDFLNYFRKLEICYLKPEHLEKCLLDEFVFHGEWTTEKGIKIKLSCFFEPHDFLHNIFNYIFYSLYY